MAQAIFVAPTGEGTGLTTVALSLVHALDRRGIPVGFCKPITQLDNYPLSQETSTCLVRHISSLNPPEPLPLAKAEELLGDGRENELLENVFARFHHASKDASIVVIEGLVPKQGSAYATSINVKIAKSLDADTILVTAPGHDTPEQLQEMLEIAAQPYGGLTHQRLPGCILNFVNAPVDANGRLRFEFAFENSSINGELTEDNFGQIANYASCPVFQTRKFRMLGCIPWQRDLVAPRVKDIVPVNEAELFNDGDLNRRVTHVALGARNLANGCAKYRPGALIITPGDREDVLLAACMAALNGIHIAALVLTGNLRPSKDLLKLCRPGLETGLPVLAIPYHTLEAVLAITRHTLEVPLDDYDRIQKVVHTVAGYLNLTWIDEILTRTDERRLSPPAFRYTLVERARQANKRIILPEGDEPRTIEAAIECERRGIAQCLLLAKPEHIHQAAARAGLAVPETIEIIDPTPAVIARYITALVNLRKAKGLTPAVAEEQLQDRVMLGTMMLAQNEVDGLVSGAVHTTANTIRPALQVIKTAPDARLVSSVFFMCLPEQVLIYGDCAINPNPNAEDLADIAIQSAESAKNFSITPRIAMLSYSTGASGQGGDVERVKEATRIARQRRPDLLIDGPLQYDAAAIMAVAQKKAPDSQVAGRATIFIFPDLNTGNTTYKAVQRSANVISIGPMLQGLKKPVNDLSRGALVEDIVFTIALTAIQAQQTKT